MNIYYKLSDGRVWSVNEAAFVQETQKTFLNHLSRAEGKNDEDYLLRTLLFYGYPLGELAEKIPDAIREQLADLDKRYLLPRTLAGLATGDDYAVEQWEKHESEALPLRQKLAALEAAKV